MALIVKLYINKKKIASYAAKRYIGGSGDLCRYRLDDGASIDHFYNDGAEALAVKVLLHQLTRKHKKEA